MIVFTFILFKGFTVQINKTNTKLNDYQTLVYFISFDNLRFFKLKEFEKNCNTKYLVFSLKSQQKTISNKAMLNGVENNKMKVIEDLKYSKILNGGC